MGRWRCALVASVLLVAVTYASVPASDEPHSLLDSVQRRSSAVVCAHRRRAAPAAAAAHRRSEESSARRSSNISYYSLLLPFCILTIGFISNVILTYFNVIIPYTVFMMLEGLLLGLLHRSTDLGVLSDSITAWDHIDPHLLMFAFLPPLLFGDAMALNFHHVKRCFWQCFTLAGPGVVIGTAFMTFVARYILPYDWSWKMAACFASITAATDPVAVVGLLNALGASKKLTMVIAGESLMNDGIAIVGFTLFKNLLHGKSYDFAGVVEFFLQVALGGPAVGIAFGILALVILILIKNGWEHTKENNASNQTTLTFVIAYLSFFIGEEVCEVSGVLACVGAGAVISGYGKSLLTEYHTLHNVWHVAEFMGNTIIFALTGIIIASDLYDAYEEDETETGKYFGWMIVVYIFMVLIRAATFAILYCPLATFGYGLDNGWKDAFVGVWGGLRGAVGLILCMIIDDDTSICNDGAPFVVLIGGATFYTLIINGVTTGPLLNALGLLKDPGMRKFLDFSVKRRIHKEVKDKFVKLSPPYEDEEDKAHPEANTDAAKTLVAILGDSWVKLNAEAKGDLADFLQKMDSADLATRVFRDMYLEMVRNEYLEMIDTNQIPAASAVPSILMQSIDYALDTKETKKSKKEENKSRCVSDRKEIKISLQIQWYHLLFDGNSAGRNILRWFGRVIARDRNAYILDAYRVAHSLALTKFKEKMEDLIGMVRGSSFHRISVEKTAGKEDEELVTILKQSVADITESCEKNKRWVEAELELIKVEVGKHGCHGIIAVLNTKKLAARTLKFQEEQMEEQMDSRTTSKAFTDKMSREILDGVHIIQKYDLISTAEETDQMAQMAPASLDSSFDESRSPAKQISMNPNANTSIELNEAVELKDGQL